MQLDRPIAIAIILFVTILLVFLLVIPAYNNFKDLRVRLGEKIAEFNAEFEYYAAITKTYYELKSRQDDLKKIDDALPTDPDLGQTIYLLQNITKESGMILKSLSLSKTSASKPQSSVSVQKTVGRVTTGSTADQTLKVNDIILSLNLVGSYSSLGQLIDNLEKSSRIFEVTNISFGAGEGSGSQVSGSSTPEPTSGSESSSQFQSPGLYNFSIQVKTHSY